MTSSMPVTADNVVLGDLGVVALRVLMATTDPGFGGDDEIITGDGDDIVLAGDGERHRRSLATATTWCSATSARS